ncbi:MAG: hypothetical protein MZV64_16685 [Ignavibacteriales bacterium]|nr:hypothetical protein [Ignavibacteriales bacterium]
MVDGAEIFIPLEGLIDVDVERARLQKEIDRLDGIARSTAAKLSNPSFVERAPADVVAKEREKLESLNPESRQAQAECRRANVSSSLLTPTTLQQIEGHHGARCLHPRPRRSWRTTAPMKPRISLFSPTSSSGQRPWSRSPASSPSPPPNESPSRRAGGTGLSGGALPVRGGILLSMDRFDPHHRDRPGEPPGDCGAGVITQKLHVKPSRSSGSTIRPTRHPAEAARSGGTSPNAPADPMQ